MRCVHNGFSTPFDLTFLSRSAMRYFLWPCKEENGQQRNNTPAQQLSNWDPKRAVVRLGEEALGGDPSVNGPAAAGHSPLLPAVAWLGREDWSGWPGGGILGASRRRILELVAPKPMMSADSYWSVSSVSVWPNSNLT